MLKILIVEDEVITGMCLKKNLEKLGYEVGKPVVSGEDAVIIALKEKPSVILMDINLIGEMDGVEAVEMINKQENIPVIYTTGYSNIEIKERAMKTQPLAYLEKPININDIKIILEDII